MQLLLGDCLEKMREMPDNSVDSIVTDPPYGLSFMGKKWDYDVPSVDIWKECLRVLKPGGHLLAFAGTRTQHRMAVRIEDAGFEIRDMIAWVYGSGFPKSLNIGKAVDKLQGNEREVVGQDKNFGVTTAEQGKSAFGDYVGIWDITKGSSEWEGWGTALKPALEPITVARKPTSESTVAENCLKWGVGGMNIDVSRVETTKEDAEKSARPNCVGKKYKTNIYGNGECKMKGIENGRFPANLIHDGSDEVVSLFPNTKGGTAVRRNSGGNTFGGENKKPVMEDLGYGDSGSASRFFYCAKASKSERNEGCDELEEKMGNKTGKGLGRDCSLEKRAQKNGDDLIRLKNNHPTVKPIALMEYLVKLVTPPKGTVLDPFMGSGSTGVACKRRGFEFIGVEMNDEYLKIAEARIAKTANQNVLL